MIQLQIKTYYSGARMPRISPKVFNNIKIPLPPLEIQKKISNHINNIKEQIKSLRLEAVKLRNNAKIDFGNEVFSK